VFRPCCQTPDAFLFKADVVAQAFAAVGSVISTASISKRPDAASLPAVLKPLSELIEKVVSIKEANRPSPLALHLNAVTDGIPSLGWVSLVCFFLIRDDFGTVCGG